MARPQPSKTPLRGDTAIREPGFTYLPRFLSADDVTELAAYFATLHPVWESRYAADDPARRGSNARLTRPVYWLGAWQFAALGYYSEPDHTEQKCVRAEPLPPVLLRFLERLQPELEAHGNTDLPNTCLINFYGSERLDPSGPPVDYARLRMHRDAEPGPVVMLSIGQPAQFEFVLPDVDTPLHSQWVRNRSVVVISGPRYKDELYHRVTQVRHGQDPALDAQIDHFSIRRISVSFRHVPNDAILDATDLTASNQAIVRPYLEELAPFSPHFRAQLDGLP